MSLSTAPRAHLRPKLLGVLLAGVVVTSASGVAFSAPAAAAPLGLHVVGNQLYKDSQPFLPRGFNMIGLLAPAWCTQGQGRVARDHFGQAAMDAAKAWNANTLRFQVSQRGLADSTVPQADRDAYLLRIADGVALARSNGFMVTLSVQDQFNGCGPAHPLPSEQTVAAWNVLGPRFQDDPYVMFELFNEPNITNNSAGWNQWQNGGNFPSTNQGAPAVGHQALVDQLRGLGTSNVLIANGLNRGQRLEGMPLLADPLNGLMYGIHPYNISVGQSWWDAKYGYLTPTRPVIATEWNYLASNCGTSAEQLAPAHLAYLRDHNIGLLAHAFDVPGTIITSDWAWTPTDCATAEGGSGRLVKDFFATQTDRDSLPPTAPTGLRGTAASAVQVDLTWNASSDNVGVAKYQVRRDGVPVGETADLAYSDGAVASNTSYSYAVRAVDAAGNVSADSESVIVTTPESSDAEPPTAPANLQGTGASSTQVDLSWETSTDDTGVREYHILRDGAKIGETPGLTYRDDTTEAHETYSYSVTAVDAAGNVSDASNSVSVTPPDTIGPTAPTSLQGSAVNSTRVDLSWRGSADNIGVTGYQVVRDGVDAPIARKCLRQLSRGSSWWCRRGPVRGAGGRSRGRGSV